MEDKGKGDIEGNGERSNGIFPLNPKKGSVVPKEKKHVSTMIGEQPANAAPHLVVLPVLSIALPMEIRPIMSSKKHKILG
uniref:Uncharacterized protein n=1 Tax=Solanum tuberosum TaxID=4113 RepID=M1CY35_SOLTU